MAITFKQINWWQTGRMWCQNGLPCLFLCNIGPTSLYRCICPTRCAAQVFTHPLSTAGCYSKLTFLCAVGTTFSLFGPITQWVMCWEQAVRTSKPGLRERNVVFFFPQTGHIDLYLWHTSPKPLICFTRAYFSWTHAWLDTLIESAA